jgi:hypothetical protein
MLSRLADLAMNWTSHLERYHLSKWARGRRHLSITSAFAPMDARHHRHALSPAWARAEPNKRLKHRLARTVALPDE